MAVIIVILLVLFYQQVLFATDPCKGTFLGSQNYKADWTVEGSIIHFVVSANVSNNWWIALGFSEYNDSQQNFMFSSGFSDSQQNFMFPSDVIIGGTNSEDAVFIEDRHNVGFQRPVLDTQSDIFDESVAVNDGTLTLKFSRLMVTDDHNGNQDVSISVARYWIWAMGPYGDDIDMHSSSARGHSNAPISLPIPEICPVGEFCEAEIFHSDLYGSYDWTQTGANLTAFQECEFGGLFGTEITYVSRRCLSGGQWSNPDFSSCRDNLPEVVITSEPALVVELGRMVSIQCVVDSYNGGDTLTWYKIDTDGQLRQVQSLTQFMNSAFVPVGSGMFGFQPSVSLDDFRRLFFIDETSVQQQGAVSHLLTSYRQQNAMVPTSADIDGVYICEGKNDFGTRNQSITIQVEGPSGDFSRVHVRATTFLSDNIPIVNEDYRLALVESRILESVNVSRDSLQIVNCVLTSLRTEDIFLKTFFGRPDSPDRLDCLIEEFLPSRTSTVRLGELILQELEMVQLIVPQIGDYIFSRFSETGFCDYELTSDSQYGDYTWNETIGGEVISIECATERGSGSMVVRRCVGGRSGWNVIDFSACRRFNPLPEAYLFYLRFSSNFFNILQSGEVEFSLEAIRITIEVTANVTAVCEQVPMQFVDSLKRVQCKINGTFDPLVESTSPSVIEDSIISALDERGYSVVGSNVTSETGFCDYELTSDSQYGNYTWNETIGGEVISIECATERGSDSMVVRRCVGGSSGWNVIDFSACRRFNPLPEAYLFYLRFSSNFFNILQSGEIETSLETIRITIELTANVTAVCEQVPMHLLDSLKRVECKINGTFDPLIESTSPSVIEDSIISALDERGYSVVGSVVTSDDGFCDANSLATANRGIFHWEETAVGVNNTQRCEYGPGSATGTRRCRSLLLWDDEYVEPCGTTNSLQFQNINESLNEVNITIDNVVIFVANLSEVVSDAVGISDQNEDNVIVISFLLTQTSNLLQQSSSTLSLEMIELITTASLDILDDVEEWPNDIIETESSEIIQAFENITLELVAQEDFENITIITEDIAFLGERIDRETFKGRILTAHTNTNGTLQISNETLETTTVATVKIPIQIISSIPEEDDVNIAFTVFTESSLFPMSKNETDIVLGSAVVSINVLGVLPQENLIAPVQLDFKIRNPNTGNSENITNVSCVFWNFQLQGGKGDWDPNGCRTIYDDSNPDEVTCECYHLTNFACLVDTTIAREEPQNFSEVRTVPYIGVILSVAFLFITVIALLIIKKLRQSDATKFHIQLCIALSIMMIVFVSGINRTDNRLGCITVGVLIHYFSLVSCLWMGAEAVLMFQKLIVVFDQITWRYFLIISVFCWAIPLLPVIVPVGIDYDFYITENENSSVPGFCFLSHQVVFFGAFVGPICLILLLNLIIFALVLYVLINHNISKKKPSMKKSSLAEVIKMIISISGIMFLFGLTWIFTVITFVFPDHDVAFGLQSFFIASQGFYIFVFFVILNGDVREGLKMLFHCFKKGEPDSNQTSKDRYSDTKSNVGSDTTDQKSLSHIIYNDSRNFDLVEYNSTAIKDYEESFSPYIIEANDPKIMEKEEVNGNQQHEMKSLSKARVKRHSTRKQRAHHVEVVELDFFDDFEDDEILDEN